MNFKKTQMAVAIASVMSLVVGNVAFAQASARAASEPLSHQRLGLTIT